MMGWDEISTSNLSYKSIIQSWRDKFSLMDAARRGYRGILSYGFYLDHMASAEYHYNNDIQVDMILNENEAKRILGGEACLWTEYISSDMVHSRVWPRTAAIAEQLWSSTSDSADCMYDRLTYLDKKFFHPNDEQFMKDLSTLALDRNALKILADVCEPLGLQARDRTRNYTSKTPLNRFVDILKPDSEQVRRLKQTTDLALLYSTFVSWKRNHFDIHSNHSDIQQLSENLSHLGDIGVRLLKLFNNYQERPIASSRWVYYQEYILNTLEYQVPEIRLAGVEILREVLKQVEPCSFDLINLSLILFFPILIIIVQRVGVIRRRLLLPCLNFCYYYCARC
jgi:hexosaminidase